MAWASRDMVDGVGEGVELVDVEVVRMLYGVRLCQKVACGRLRRLGALPAGYDSVWESGKCQPPVNAFRWKARYRERVFIAFPTETRLCHTSGAVET